MTILRRACDTWAELSDFVTDQYQEVVAVDGEPTKLGDDTFELFAKTEHGHILLVGMVMEVDEHYLVSLFPSPTPC